MNGDGRQPLESAADAVLMAYSSGELDLALTGFLSAVGSVYSPLFDDAAGAAGAAVGSVARGRSSGEVSAMQAAGQRVGEMLVSEAMRQLAGATWLATALLDRLAQATGRQPGVIVREILDSQEEAD